MTFQQVSVLNDIFDLGISIVNNYPQVHAIEWLNFNDF